MVIESEAAVAEADRTLGELRARLADGADEVREYAETAGAAIRDFARERPLVAVLCAAGVGFVLGRLLSRL